MNSFSFCKQTVIASLLVFLFPLVAQADPPDCKPVGGISERPLSDFLNTQGTTSGFLPPIGDYAGWATPDVEDPPPGFDRTFALIDYAGLANAYLESLEPPISLGTKVRGKIQERECANGSAEIRMKIFTQNALGFASSVNEIFRRFLDLGEPGFLCAVPIFGARAQDLAGINLDSCSDPTYLVDPIPTLGNVQLDVSFTISAPGAAIPDLLDVLDVPCDYVPVKLSFYSTVFGERPSGGTNVVMLVQQTGSLSEKSCPQPENARGLNYTKEVVNIIGLDN